MKVLVFSKKDISVIEENYLKDFYNTLQRDNYDVVSIDTEEVDGIAKAEIYDIYSTPSVVVTTNEGLFIQGWKGEIPPLSEVKYYLFTI